MATEALNAVSPWMGELEWVGDPRTGTSKKGNEWKSVDFVLKYADPQGNEGKILFSAFGSEKVDKILSAPLGTMVKVMWRPEAREYNGKWFGKLDAYDVSIAAAKKAEGNRQEPEEDLPPDDDSNLQF